MDPLLTLSTDIPEPALLRSENLSSGFIPSEKVWQVIARFQGSLASLSIDFPEVNIERLYSQYAILTIPEDQINAVNDHPSIIYMEKANRIYA